MARNFLKCLSLLAVLLPTLIGCMGTGQQVVHMWSKVLRPPEPVLPANRQYQYLKIDAAEDGAAYFALGYAYSRDNQSVEDWYSSTGQLIEIVGGRIAYTVGLKNDVRNLYYEMPPIEVLREFQLSGRSIFSYEKTYDLTSVGYGIKEKIQAEVVKLDADLYRLTEYGLKNGVRFISSDVIYRKSDDGFFYQSGWQCFNFNYCLKFERFK